MCLISIIIPVFEVEQYIERTLRSVIDQDFEGNYEIIIVDDCGKDNSIGVVENFILQNKVRTPIHIIRHSHNMGGGEASNTGIKASSGEYILFVDADDTISRDCLSKLYNCASSNNLDVCVGSMRKIWNSEQYTDFVYRKTIFDCPSAGFELFRKGIDTYTSRWNRLVRTEFLRSNEILCKHRIWEDQYFSFLLACYAQRFGILPDVTYNYIMRENSIVNSLSRKKPAIESIVGLLEDTRIIIKEKFSCVQGVYDYYLHLVRFSFATFLQSNYSFTDYKRFYLLTKNVNRIIPSKDSLLFRKNRVLYMLKVDNLVFFHLLYSMQNAIRTVRQRLKK